MKSQKIKLVTLLLFVILFTGCQPNPIIPTGSFVDDRDGEVYATVTIGSQTWMAENLRYDAPGSLLNPSNPTEIYGRLYNWPTLMDGAEAHGPFTTSNIQGLCPKGWHIPTDGEWSTLEIAHGMDPKDSTSTDPYRGHNGRAFKSTTDWEDIDLSMIENGTNSLGFNAYPAGTSRDIPQAPQALGIHTMFWSSSMNKEHFPLTRVLGLYPYGNVGRIQHYELNYLSCRCIQD